MKLNFPRLSFFEINPFYKEKTAPPFQYKKKNTRALENQKNKYQQQNSFGICYFIAR